MAAPSFWRNASTQTPVAFDAARLYLVALAGLAVFTTQPHHFAAVVAQAGGGAIIEQQGAVGGRRARQGQGQAGVVKLGVPVFDAALQALRLDRGQAVQGLLAVQEFGGAQTSLAGQSVVYLETNPVKRCFPTLVGWHYKG